MADLTGQYRDNWRQNGLRDSFVHFLNFKLKWPREGVASHPIHPLDLPLCTCVPMFRFFLFYIVFRTQSEKIDKRYTGYIIHKAVRKSTGVIWNLNAYSMSVITDRNQHTHNHTEWRTFSYIQHKIIYEQTNSVENGTILQLKWLRYRLGSRQVPRRIFPLSSTGDGAFDFPPRTTGNEAGGA